MRVQRATSDIAEGLKAAPGPREPPRSERGPGADPHPGHTTTQCGHATSMGRARGGGLPSGCVLMAAVDDLIHEYKAVHRRGRVGSRRLRVP
jgi:hypothetical protein